MSRGMPRNSPWNRRDRNLRSVWETVQNLLWKSNKLHELWHWPPPVPFLPKSMLWGVPSWNFGIRSQSMRCMRRKLQDLWGFYFKLYKLLQQSVPRYENSQVPWYMSSWNFCRLFLSIDCPESCQARTHLRDVQWKLPDLWSRRCKHLHWVQRRPKTDWKDQRMRRYMPCGHCWRLDTPHRGHYLCRVCSWLHRVYLQPWNLHCVWTQQEVLRLFMRWSVSRGFRDS